MEMQLTPVTNRPVFMNRQLEKVTQSILECGSTIQSRRYAIAALLAKVQSEGLYKDDGFGHASEYATATFGIEKTLAYDLIRMGQQFTRPILNAKGKVTGYCSNLMPPAHPDEQDAPLLDFTPTQISRFMSLGREKVLTLVSSGELHPRMTIKDIQAFVKAQKALEKGVETSFTEPATEPATAPAEPVAEPTEPATAPATEPRFVPEPRDAAGFDEVPSDWLIAELRARKFIVYDANGREWVIDWKS